MRIGAKKTELNFFSYFMGIWFNKSSESEKNLRLHTANYILRISFLAIKGQSFMIVNYERQLSPLVTCYIFNKFNRRSLVILLILTKVGWLPNRWSGKLDNPSLIWLLFEDLGKAVQVYEISALVAIYIDSIFVLCFLCYIDLLFLSCRSATWSMIFVWILVVLVPGKQSGCPIVMDHTVKYVNFKVLLWHAPLSEMVGQKFWIWRGFLLWGTIFPVGGQIIFRKNLKNTYYRIKNN